MGTFNFLHNFFHVHEFLISGFKKTRHSLATPTTNNKINNYPHAKNAMSYSVISS